MARADSNHATRLYTMFRDPFLCAAAFKAAEDDSSAPALVETDHPRTLDGGTVVSLELVEA
jgi:hypothetical protein